MPLPLLFHRRSGRILGGVLLASLAMPMACLAQEPATRPAAAPTTAPAEAAGSNDPAAQIVTQIKAAATQLHELLPTTDPMFDAKQRTELAPKIVPVLRRFEDAVTQFAHLNPDAAENTDQYRIRTLAMLSLFGDADTDAALAKMAGGGNADEALVGSGAQLLTQWWRASKDPAAQLKAVDGLNALVKDHATNGRVVMTAMLMNESGEAAPENGQKVRQILIDGFKGDGAAELAQQLQHENQLLAMVNKPLTLAGPTLDGKQFTSADYKGKVILVDFWASWCPPCRAELPRVEKAYADWHAKGLEVLGVSCDNEVADLKAFIEQDKQMPWTQLFDASKPGWHALATSYGIEGIPTMFLIDKKGIVRSVTARKDFEEQIPKLLEEKAE